jgi:hypothetical protein
VQYDKHSGQRIGTSRGIVIDLTEEDENDLDSMRVNSGFVPNEIDESELECEKHSEQRI